MGTGAILNFSGDNTWRGPVNLANLPGFLPPTTPNPDFVSFGANADSSLLIDGIIDEAASAPALGYGLTKVGPGRIILAQDNQYNRRTHITAGVLNVRHGGALGTPGSGDSGTVVDAGAALEIENGPGITVAGEALILNGTGVAGTGALRNVSGDNTFDGDITLVTATSIGAAAGSSLDLTGVLMDPTPVPPVPATLGKVGPGTVILSNNNTYTGLTTVFGGTLQVNGSTGDVELDGGTLGGEGVVVDVTSASGGTVNPGDPVGTLTADDVVWDANTTFFVDLVNATTFDRLVVNGTINLGNATLDGAVADTVLVNDMFTILTAAGGITGAFNGLADGELFSLGGRLFVIDYTPNAVTVIPP
jgi:autotransporter-associated beta strand protein